MFFLPDSAPWWAVLGIAFLFIVVTGVGVVLRAVWPQRSSDRKELLTCAFHLGSRPDRDRKSESAF